MRILAAVCVHDRVHLLERWLRAWPGMWPRPYTLLVVNPYDGGPHPGVAAAVKRWDHKDVILLNRPNQGQDIGSFRAIVGLQSLPFDVLCWFSDDCLPMRWDCFHNFMAPFNDPSAGLVSFAYEPPSPTNLHAHARTVAFSVRQDVARRFRWPDRLDTCVGADRAPCFAFEHGPDNMYRQVLEQGYRAVSAVGAPPFEEGYAHWSNNADFMWDCGHQPEKKLWDEFDRVHNKIVLGGVV